MEWQWLTTTRYGPGGNSYVFVETPANAADGVKFRLKFLVDITVNRDKVRPKKQFIEPSGFSGLLESAAPV